MHFPKGKPRKTKTKPKDASGNLQTKCLAVIETSLRKSSEKPGWFWYIPLSGQSPCLLLSFGLTEDRQWSKEKTWAGTQEHNSMHSTTRLHPKRYMQRGNMNSYNIYLYIYIYIHVSMYKVPPPPNGPGFWVLAVFFVYIIRNTFFTVALPCV